MMDLRKSVMKKNGPGVHREFSAEETWERVSPHILRAGVTRVADITHLDRIGLPVYNAISPRSNDIISVYNGKGFRSIDAKVSAVMEAVERFAAWLPVRPDYVATYNELVASGHPVMHPSEYNLEVAGDYRDANPISWVWCWDLLNEERVLVPQDGAVYQPRLHEQPCYKITTTNGLASGNSLEEAICHALSELVERDSMTIAEVISNRLPQALKRGGLDLGVEKEQIIDELRGRHPHVRVHSLPPRAMALVEKYRAAGLDVRIVDITSDLGVPSFFVATAENLGPHTSQGHGGFGTHPDAEVALVRAITECAQGRAVDIQAMREDITLPGTDVPKYQFHVRRSAKLDREAWAWLPASRTVDFGSIKSTPSSDIMDDVSYMLEAIKAAGLPRVLVYDLSPPHMPVAVVRIIVPGLESWAVDHCRLGARSAQAWNRAVSDVLSSRKKQELSGRGSA
ncbi:YcaO-like family protein [Streptomyces sp. NPDC059452]|uniref:YcaO-like family protein n=1 Tax=Streptomyces sp. NPDC059452 TaxID=3346835 RepID=UPI00369F36C6